MKLAPTTKGYTNKDIFICGLKFVRKNVNIRKNLMDKEIYNILKMMIYYMPLILCFKVELS